MITRYAVTYIERTDNDAINVYTAIIGTDMPTDAVAIPVLLDPRYRGENVTIVSIVNCNTAQIVYEHPHRKI